MSVQIDRSISHSGPWAARLVKGLIAGCAGLASPPQLTSDWDNTHSHSLDVEVDTYRAFNRSSSNEHKNGACAVKQSTLLDAGFALMRCWWNAYLTSLCKAAKNFRFASNETMHPSDVVLVMSGSMNTAPEAILSKGAIFALGVASMGSYEYPYIGPPKSMGIVRRRPPA
jgi:hypothetical protein